MTGSSTNFFASFASSPQQGYELAIPEESGAAAAGDRNATYFSLYYSIYNLVNSWEAQGYCPVELVIAGNFPDSRYFSITSNDMHKTIAQHLADEDVVPVGTSQGQSYLNPFALGSTGTSPEYNGKQAYLVPISLGAVPGPTTANGGTVLPGCYIDPFEGANLLDATQRHPSADWNTTVPSSSAFQAPGVLSGLLPHVVDNPAHVFDSATNSGPNTAGGLRVRYYLAPPETCSTNDATGEVTCNQPTSVQQPYMLVRDTVTGCAYPAQTVMNYLWYDQSSTVSPACNLGDNCPTASTAVLSTGDPSALGVSNWLDLNQQNQHSHEANITPEACYADGDPTLASPPPYANRVAWVRSPQWEADPGPDDNYVGGAISTSDLGNMLPTASGGPGSPLCNNSQSNPSTDGCVMRFRFKLPATPGTPCQETGGAYDCRLGSEAQLRYMSLTFWYRTNTQTVSNGNPISVVSLADPAFAQIGSGSEQYVTLLVNVGANLPGWLQQPANLPPCAAAHALGCGVTAGIQPPTNSPPSPAYPAYSAWTTANGYTVLDLTQFTGQNPFSAAYPLLVSLRNQLPNMTPSAPFNCSVTAVPFSTAEYTERGGMMGPYAPLVDYADPMNQTALPQTPAKASGQPPESACGVLPDALPGFNAPQLSTTDECQTAGSTCTDWPNQSWPTSTPTQPPPLNCTTSQPASPQIFFVGTQFPTPAPSYSANCSTESTVQTPNPCNQIVMQSTQTFGWRPPLPVTIVGQGFGYLPNVGLPFVGLAHSLVGPGHKSLLTINDDGKGPGGTAWDTAQNAACQVYISNWTDTSISLMANLSVGLQDPYQQQDVLSPLSDFGPLTMGAASGCPVVSGDSLTFVVTNPQTGQSAELRPAVPVVPVGTSPN
jgi:hypothetical protein